MLKVAKLKNSYKNLPREKYRTDSPIIPRRTILQVKADPKMAQEVIDSCAEMQNKFDLVGVQKKTPPQEDYG